MWRTIGATAAVLLLTACSAGESHAVCGACAAPHSSAVLLFSVVPQAPRVSAEVCVGGGPCYQVRAKPHPGDELDRACWTDSFPRVTAKNRHACDARAASDGTWHLSVQLPGNVDGKTVSVRSTTAEAPFAGQSVGLAPDDGGSDGPCSCPAYPVATVDVR
jgi:hypothetical protein